MVESRSVRAAEMVSKLKTVNKWCVSGTPIQKGLQGEEEGGVEKG